MKTIVNKWDKNDRYISIKTTALRLLRESVTSKKISYKEYFIFMTLLEHLSTKTYYNSSNVSAKILSKRTNIPRNTIYKSLKNIENAVPELMQIGRVLDDLTDRYIFNPDQIKNSMFIQPEVYDNFALDYPDDNIDDNEYYEEELIESSTKN